MIKLIDIKRASTLFTLVGILLLPFAIAECFLGFEYSSYILIADSYHTFVDIAFALIISLGLKIILNRRIKRISNGIYNIESILIVFASIAIVYFAIELLISTLDSLDKVEEEAPPILALIPWISGIVTLVIYFLERRYSWIGVVRTDMIHSKLDIASEALTGLSVIISNPFLTIISTVIIVSFLLADVIKEVKEAVYSIIGIKVDSPIRDEIFNILSSKGFKVLDVTLRKMGSFLATNVIIALPSNTTLAHAYKIKKEVKRILYGLDNVIMVELTLVPLKSAKLESIVETE